jgi:hypothetical protein
MINVLFCTANHEVPRFVVAEHCNRLLIERIVGSAIDFLDTRVAHAPRDAMLAPYPHHLEKLALFSIAETIEVTKTGCKR